MYAFSVITDKGIEVHQVIKSEVFAVVADLAGANRVIALIQGNDTPAKKNVGKKPAPNLAAVSTTTGRRRGRQPGYSPKAAKEEAELAVSAALAAGNATATTEPPKTANAVHTPAQAARNAPPVDEDMLANLVTA